VWHQLESWNPFQVMSDPLKVSFQQGFPLNYPRNFSADATIIGSSPLVLDPAARPNGFAEMQAVYQVAQVRKVKMIITIDRPVTETAADQAWRIVLQACPHSFYSSFPDNIEELQAQHIPIATRLISHTTDKKSTFRLSLTVKPSDLDSYPTYYGQDASWYACRVSTPPGFQCKFIVSVIPTNYAATIAATQRYTMRVKWVVWQRWWGKDSSNIQSPGFESKVRVDHALPSLSDPPFPEIPGLSLSRAVDAAREGKEKKKDDDDDDDDPEFANYKDLSLALPSTPTVKPLIPLTTCLTASHPRVPHEKVGTCT